MPHSGARRVLLVPTGQTLSGKLINCLRLVGLEGSCALEQGWRFQAAGGCSAAMRVEGRGLWFDFPSVLAVPHILFLGLLLSNLCPIFFIFIFCGTGSSPAQSVPAGPTGEDSPHLRVP